VQNSLNTATKLPARFMSTNDSTFDSFAPVVGRGFVEQRCATTGATANALSSRSCAGTCVYTDSAVLIDGRYTRSHKISPCHATPRRGTRPTQYTPPTYCRMPRRPKDIDYFEDKKKVSRVNCYRGESHSFLSRCRKTTPTVFHGNQPPLCKNT